MMFHALCLVGGLMLPQLAPSRADDAEFFEKRIRPALVEHCHKCHSAGAEPLKGGLALDSKEALLAGGESGPAIVPGDPEASRLARAISHMDPDLQMPPKYKLPEEVRRDLVEWIRLGAPWPGSPAAAAGQKPPKDFDLAGRRESHWAWSPTRDPAPPQVRNPDWVENPVDRFILAGLEAQGLTPAKPASKAELLRRATFDLNGLPPTPEELEAFEGDASAGAFATVVDRLLESPRFGERWGRHWFDLVRYAETYGHEFDYAILNAWRYRDYVIRAFNQNLPQDQFLREQIAGDLLPNPRWSPEGLNESVAATTFHWLGQQVHSPVDIRAYQLDRVDNQIDVLTKTFMGMTVSCARCHDHKFDAISTKDFYALFGVTASSRYSNTSLLNPEVNAPVIQELGALKAEIRRELAEAWAKDLGDLATHIQAAAEMAAPPQAPAEDSTPGMVVFEDFESGDYAGWEISGEAFGSAPQSKTDLPDYQGDVAPVGERFVNSHRPSDPAGVAGGDKAVGSLTSRPFTVGHDYIHFLIGGGAHKGKTGVRLLIDGKEAAWVSGSNQNRMRPAKMATHAFRGKTARLAVVDQEKGGWGNVGLDHIVFSDWDKVFDGANQPLKLFGSPAEFAKRRGLDPGRLQAVARLLDTSGAEAGSEPPMPSPNDLTLYDAGAHEHAWLGEGEAFQSVKTRPGGLVLPPKGGSPAILAEGAIQSDAVHTRLEGALRTQTFTIERTHIHIRGGGEEARVNLVVDGFNLIRSPIYGGLRQDFRGGEPRWVTIDAAMWVGHQAYLEFMDQSVADPAGDRAGGPDSHLWVSKILFSNDPAPPKRGRSPGLAAASAGDAAAVEALQAAVRFWGADTPGEPPAGFEASMEAASRLLTAGFLAGRPPQVAPLLERYDAAAARLTPPAYVPAITDGSPRNAHVFIRGNPRNLGEEVPRRFVEALDESAFSKGSGRLELAERLLAKDNPLTARVRVNWIWHHLMGRGLVASVDNFGVLGEKPSHPELLDWLASRFLESGWDMKRLIRTVMLSNTYQMASRDASAEAAEKDPNNHLFHRANLRRLEGEVIRDAILAVAGTLDPKMFGPPVPVYLTEFMEGRGRPGTSGPLDGAGRRTVYQEVRRNFLSPVMLAYDAPIPYTTVGRRTISNVPAQALILMNDPFVLEQARRWAGRLVEDGDADPSRRINQMYLAALARSPDSGELAAALEFLRERLDLNGLSESELASNTGAWADLCHVLLNTKEFIYIQ